MKLHLGSGKNRIPGFLNVDIRPEVNPDIVSNAVSLPMIDTDSVDEIYFCHGIEHLKYAEVQPALAEWKRILTPGGLLRLSVPDFAALCGIYASKQPRKLHLIRGALSGGQEYPDNIHYSAWDEMTLVEVLTIAGYSNIWRYDARRWLVATFGKPSLRGIYFDWSIGRIAGVDISLNVVAEGV